MMKNNFESNKVYKKKYSCVKKVVKKFVYENAALCDQVFQLQEKILCLTEERNYLLKLGVPDDSSTRRPSADVRSSQDNVDNSVFKGSSQVSTNKLTNVKRKPDDSIGDKKKMRKTCLPVKKKTLFPVPVDSSGLPVFPVNLGSLSVHSLGEIMTDRPTFHDQDLIYPVGYCSTRVYGSLSDPSLPCIYTCMIQDGGNGPVFQLTSDTDLEKSIAGDDINAVHIELLQLINGVVGVDVVNTRGRGADFFGISHPTVLNLLQSSPGIKKCHNYKPTKFELNKSGEPYVEENDASLNFESLQRSISFTRSHMEEMDEQETLDSTATLRNLLNS